MFRGLCWGGGGGGGGLEIKCLISIQRVVIMAQSYHRLGC